MKNTLKTKNLLASRLFAVVISSLMLKSASSQDFSDFFSNNSSFEFGSSAPPLSFPSANSSLNTITGWQLNAMGAYPLWLEDVFAQQGNRYIRLKSSGGSGVTASSATIDGSLISHTPFTTGGEYEIAFWAAGGPASNNTIRITMNAQQSNILIPTYSPSEFDTLQGLVWNKYVVPFTADGPTMYFSAMSPNSPNPAFNSIVYLDNFSIVAVPEPGSVLMVLTAGLALGIRRRRPVLGS